MIRVCPKRDFVCPHGIDCPYSIDRYSCKEIETAATAPQTKKAPPLSRAFKYLNVF